MLLVQLRVYIGLPEENNTLISKQTNIECSEAMDNILPGNFYITLTRCLNNTIELKPTVRTFLNGTIVSCGTFNYRNITANPYNKEMGCSKSNEAAVCDFVNNHRGEIFPAYFDEPTQTLLSSIPMDFNGQCLLGMVVTRYNGADGTKVHFLPLLLMLILFLSQ